MPSDPALREAIRQRLKTFDEERFGERLWRRDPTLWKHDPEHQKIIANALGWLTVPEAMRARAGDLAAFAAEVAADGYTDAVLLGMGGSSLAPEVLRATFGVKAGYLDLRVCDSTDPTAVRLLDDEIDLARTLFIVSSKSGGTTETASFHAYFYERVKAVVGDEQVGRHFIAITDPDTSLHKQALEQRFRAVFLNPADIGGRYSALSYFGLVPAALIGLDLERLLAHAVQVAQACGDGEQAAQNPALKLGAALGELARGGRDKITFFLSPSIAAFGAWLEQLIAESTGKEGTGMLPIDGETPGPPAVYGDDRVFVYLHVSGEPDARTKATLHELGQAGHPTMALPMPDIWDIGGEFLRWEIAVAAAGAVLGIDPFDQPNVQESKDNTRRLLRDYVAGGRLPDVAGPDGRWPSVGAGDDALPAALRELLGAAREGDYIAIQAYVPPSEADQRILHGLRMLLRDRLGLATTLGYGPRFLHSTGQLHKGGKPNGLFLQLTCGAPHDLEIPGEPYTFGVLKQAQARGDLEALVSRGLRALQVDLGAESLPGLTALGAAVSDLLRG
ncbi:MAG TPA: glucose-6-phosphate isomerase [Thermoleophilia bacterium]|nr:glucose-6-phosphate isomerase [Thermoleophilia bacterium]